MNFFQIMYMTIDFKKSSVIPLSWWDQYKVNQGL